MALDPTDIILDPNLLYYAIKRNSWVLDPLSYFGDFSNVEVNSPVFLLGTHGGGLTLVSRMLRRNERVVSVSGNHKYWSGADEMAVVLGSILPFELGGIKHNLPDHPYFKDTTAWVYASDELISRYRLRARDATSSLRQTFLRILRWRIFRHAQNPAEAQFTDKSQVYTVRASFIAELLSHEDPRFILVTRDPYVLAYRAPDKAAALRGLPPSFSRMEKIRIAAQHWNNSMEAALEDGENITHFSVIRFEDMLRNPKKCLHHICEVTAVEFSSDMLPSMDDHVPFGSRYRDRWYPLRENVNAKYYRKMDPKHVEEISKVCGETAEKLGYHEPDLL